MKTEHQLRIEEFMRHAQQELPSSPSVPDAKVRLLRARLILEEALETVDALGVVPVFEWSLNTGARVEMSSMAFVVDPEADVRLEEIADGCADISVVTVGTLSACGIPDKPIIEAVDANNLAKFGPGHRIDEHGKLIKPPNHKPPDLKRIIEALRSDE